MPIHHPALRTVSCLLSIAAMLLIAGCAHRPIGDAQAARWQHARQVVLVTTADWNADHGTLRSFSRADDGDWHMVGAPFPVVIGRTGAAWGIGLHDVPPDSDGPVKQEGDGRSPAGVFTIGEAFG
jgi:L,D-peptidoglycan transpeptidase YkuD (ErfK/YbiS/YcfS/YnhG family)